MRPEAACHVEGVDQVGLAVDGDRDRIVVTGEQGERKIEPRGPMTRESNEALGNDLPRECKNDALALHSTDLRLSVRLL